MEVQYLLFRSVSMAKKQSPVDAIAAIRKEADAKIAAMLDDLKQQEKDAMAALREVQHTIISAGGRPSLYNPPNTPTNTTRTRRRRSSASGGVRGELLKYLASTELATAQEAADAIGASKASVAVTLSGLFKDGLIERPNRGQNSITTKGKKELGKMSD